MSDISNAIKHICEEKGLSYDAVLVTIESALAAAYRKDFGQKNQNIVVQYDPETNKSKVYDIKTVVEDMPEVEEKEEAEAVDDVKEDKKNKKDEKKEDKKEKKKEDEKEIKEEPVKEEEEERRFNSKTEIQFSDARLIKKTAKIDDVIKTKLEIPEEYGRMAAQTAKQVIIQRLREAEREMVYSDFKDKENEVVSGVVQRREGRAVLIDLGKTAGILPPDEQIQGERYNTGDRVKVYVKEVNLKTKGPEIVLSRTSEEILKKIFYLEIPEVSNGLIEIKSVAREAGSRSKVAVMTESDSVDPIGSCIGQRGARIQTVISELGGEKVDIIEYDEDPISYISNALSPAKIIGIEINEKESKATVKVASDQLSLAIGKGGQNARLAAKLTNWKIDIIEGDDGKEKNNEDGEENNEEEEVNEKEEKEIIEEEKTDEKEVEKVKEVKEKKIKTKKKKKETEEVKEEESKEDEAVEKEIKEKEVEEEKEKEEK